MKLEFTKKCTVLSGMGIFIVNVLFFTFSEFVHEILQPPQSLIQSSYKYDGNLCSLSGLSRSCLALTK